MNTVPLPLLRRTILAVDDDSVMLKTLRDLLTRDGFDVLTAQDAEEALTILDQQLPSLILADVMLPGVDGFTLCRQLKQNPRTANIPVVMVTGKVDEADVFLGFTVGAVDDIKKPFDRDEVCIRVRTQIRLREVPLEQQRLKERLAVISAA
jgi:DNA-binding response OmpR family regulator